MNERSSNPHSVIRRLILLTVIGMISLLIGCGSGSDTTTQVAVKSDRAIPGNMAASGVKPIKLSAAQPKIEFQKTEHSFGKVFSGEAPSTEFIFKNTGEGTLLIEHVKAG